MKNKTMQMTHPNFSVTTLGKKKEVCYSTEVFKVSSHFVPNIIFYPNAVDSYPSLGWFETQVWVGLKPKFKLVRTQTPGRFTHDFKIPHTRVREQMSIIVYDKLVESSEK